jgi:hypothetical protein
MKCFLFDALLGRSIESADAVEMDCSEAMSEWDSLSNVPGSFFGLSCPSYPTIQFMWEESDHVTIDLPLPEKGGSLTKQSGYDECRKIIEGIYDGDNPMTIAGLHFVPWK